jgi:hypothetical protein
MSIQIHPDAIRRFDELAKELLTKVSAEPSVASRQTGFRPDIYPVAHISESDVIGDIRQTHSIVDGTQEEVGRLFQYGSVRVGLVGAGFKNWSSLRYRCRRVRH